MPKSNTLKINLKPIISVVVGIAAFAGLWWKFDDRYMLRNTANKEHAEIWVELKITNMKGKLTSLISRKNRLQEKSKTNPELKTYCDELTREIRRVKTRIEELEGT